MRFNSKPLELWEETFEMYEFSQAKIIDFSINKDFYRLNLIHENIYDSEQHGESQTELRKHIWTYCTVFYD